MKKLLLALAFLFLPSLAHSEPITFGFTGSAFWFNPSVSGYLNSPFSGSYTFDSEATPSSSGPISAQYIFNGPPYGMTIDFLGVERHWTGLEITVINDQFGFSPPPPPPLPSDLYLIIGKGGPLTFFHLRDCNGTMLSGIALPLTPPNISGTSCAISDEVIIQGEGIIDVAHGDLTSLFLIPSAAAQHITEPPAWLLMGLGLIVLARAFRREGLLR
jgi:hypothetical protein